MVQTLYLNNCKKQSEQENHMLLNRPKKGGIDMYKPAWQDLNISEYVYTRIWKPVDFGDETRDKKQLFVLIYSPWQCLKFSLDTNIISLKIKMDLKS